MSEHELQLQRLVDGQLDRSQIQQLLRKAQQHPELWQQIATAFVEDQIWKVEIGERFSATAESTEISDLNEVGKPHPGKPHPSANAENHAQPFAKGLKWALSLAAATLIGLWIGNQFGDNISNEGRSDIVSVGDAVDTDPELTSNQAVDQVDDAPRVTFQPVEHLSIGDLGQVPLYNLADAQKMGLSFAESEIPKQLVERYERQGYRLQQDTQYISGRTQNGRQVLVPVRSISLNAGN